MGLTHFPNGVSSFGMPVLPYGLPVSINQKIFFVDPANGSDSNDGLSPETALATVTAAYALCTANQHDIVFYIAGSSGLNLSATLTWAKNYTHLIGMAAPSGIASRARFFQLSTATGLSPLINITASGCIFANWYVFQGVDDATSLINVQVTGNRNYFQDVHFAGGGHDTMAIDNCASLFVNGGHENRFVRCTLGVDTIALATGGNVLRFDGSASRNEFIDCKLSTLIDNEGARLVELVDGTAVDRITWFRNCLFISNSVNKATTMASAFEIPAHTTTATIYLDRQCSGMGFTDWEDDDRGILYLDKGTITAGGNAGIAQVSAAT